MKYLLFAGVLFAMFRLLWWGEMFWRKANAEMTETPIRTRILATVAGVLGIVIHIEGLPFGRRGFFDTVPSGVDVLMGRDPASGSSGTQQSSK